MNVSTSDEIGFKTQGLPDLRCPSDGGLSLKKEDVVLVSAGVFMHSGFWYIRDLRVLIWFGSTVSA